MICEMNAGVLNAVDKNNGLCQYLVKPCDAPVTKALQMFMYAPDGSPSSTGWHTIWLCDEHYEDYARLADHIPGLMVRF